MDGLPFVFIFMTYIWRINYLSYKGEVSFILIKSAQEIFCLYQTVTEVNFIYSGGNSVMETSFTLSKNLYQDILCLDSPFKERLLIFDVRMLFNLLLIFTWVLALISRFSSLWLMLL